MGAVAAQAQAIKAYLGQTETEVAEKMNRRGDQLEKQVKALILTQGD